MARAGFTTIHSGQIRFGKDGRWYCDDEAVSNRAICRLYSRSITVLPDGTARLEMGADKTGVLIEDTPWVVTMVERAPDGTFTVILNDETREPLDPGSLRVGPEHVLYCRVKGGQHEARLLRPAYYELLRHAEPGPADECTLAVGGRRITIPARSE